MNMTIHEMLGREREKDLLRQAAQARLVKAARAARAQRGGTLRAYLQALFTSAGRWLKAPANTG